MRFRRSLAQVTANLNSPFGYTLATWASGSIVAHFLGLPGLTQVFAFVAGGIGAYVTIASISESDLAPVTDVQTRRATIINLLATVTATVIALVVQLLQTQTVAYLVGGFVDTLVYMLSFALFSWLTSGRRSDQQSATPPTRS